MPQYRSFEVAERATRSEYVELSLDRIIQGIVEKELKHVVEEFDPLSASIIVGDPQQVDLFSLSAMYLILIPTISTNTNYQPREIVRFLILYEPGSTFKIVPVCASPE